MIMSDKFICFSAKIQTYIKDIVEAQFKKWLNFKVCIV